jgi:hypothetical protein
MQGINGRELGAVSAWRGRAETAHARVLQRSRGRPASGVSVARTRGCATLSSCGCPSGEVARGRAAAGTRQVVPCRRSMRRKGGLGGARGRRRAATSGDGLRSFVGSGKPRALRRQSIGQRSRALRGSTAAGGAGVRVDGAAPNCGPALARAWRGRQWLAGSVELRRRAASRSKGRGRGKRLGRKPARG